MQQPTKKDRHESFERRWRDAPTDGVSGRVGEFLRSFYIEFTRAPVVLDDLRTSIVRLLEYLASVDGGTEENCYAADSFVCLLTAERDDLLDDLPTDFQSIIDEIAMNLHEAVRDPELGEQFESTPEHLLRKARELALPN